MAIDLGIDPQQIESAKGLLRRIVRDPVALRFVVCLLLLVLGWASVLSPQGASLAAARKGLKKAEKRARMAQELRFFESEKKRLLPHFFDEADIVEWQRYVLAKLELSGARLRALEPKKTVSRGAFKVLELSLDATGTYAQLADFVDRVEHGEKVVRFSRLRLERRKETIVLEAVLDALVRAGGKAAGEDEAAGKGAAAARRGAAADAADDAEPADEVEPDAGGQQDSDGDEAAPGTGAPPGGEPTSVPAVLAKERAPLPAEDAP